MCITPYAYWKEKSTRNGVAADQEIPVHVTSKSGQAWPTFMLKQSEQLTRDEPVASLPPTLVAMIRQSSVQVLRLNNNEVAVKIV